MSLFLITFVIWAALHSITAAFSTKDFVRKRIGQAAYDGLYRLGYNIFALITYLPVTYILYMEVPMTAVWHIPAPFSTATLFIRWAGIVGFIISLFQTDIWEFAGLRPALRYLTKDDRLIPPESLVIRGTYGWVRHPLYLFSLMAIWFSPFMSINGLISNSLITIYFFIGSMYEEKRLEVEFGEAYTLYKQNVPAFLPALWRKSK